MKNDIVRFVFILGVLVCAGTAEVMLPDIGGVGFPLLLTVALLAAEVWSSRFWVLTALAAGALEDALCSLPFAASISFFLTAAFAARLSSAPGAVTVLAYPLFQLWAGILSPGGNSFARFALAFPVSALTVALAAPLFRYLRGKAGVDAR